MTYIKYLLSYHSYESLIIALGVAGQVSNENYKYLAFNENW